MIYILVAISLLVGIYSIYKDIVWKNRILETLEGIHVNAYSANQSTFKLLKLAQGVCQHHFVDSVVEELLDEDFEGKVSDR